jgi:acyl-[acyl-carrier-protein]-phospholipid O-acyltransferase/long-chain-fatty-acid--[acyl-carrier-protein] ligase
MTKHNESTPLLTSRRFLPIFIVQLLGALNDNLFRNAIFVLVTFNLAQSQGVDAPMIVSMGAGLFILPFFLFSALAGRIADRFEKTRLVQILKAVECFLVCAAGASLCLEQVHLMLGILFLLGVQAAFFGPVKYSILPRLVTPDELVAANGYVEGGTFLAILAGTIAGSLAITLAHGAMIVAVAMGVLALAGWAVSYTVPKTGAGDPTLAVGWRFLRATGPVLRDAAANKPIWRAILGISWFWFVGAIFLSVLPDYVKDTLGGTPHLVTFLLTLFSVGIAAGSVACSRLLKGKVDASFVPLGALGMSIAIFALYALSTPPLTSDVPLDVTAFLSLPRGLGISAALLLMAVAGGLFTVPLYATMQARSDEAGRARVIAANNIVNSVFMVVSSLFTMAMFAHGYKVADIFLATAILSLIAAIYVCTLLPQPVAKMVFRLLLRAAYRVKVSGMENLATLDGKGAVFIVNHVSLIDGLLLAAFLPGYPTFAVNTHIARSPVVKLFLRLADHCLIDPTNPMALKSLVAAVDVGRHVVIFPEGRITMTGALMKIYEGPGIVAINAHAPVVPVRIDGAQYTVFSYLRGKVRRHLFPQIDIAIQSPVTLNPAEGLTSRQRRKAIGAQLYDLMAETAFAASPIDKTLYEALLEARHLNGGGTGIIEDVDRNPMSYDRLVTVSRVLGRPLAAATAPGEIVGVMLPNGAGVASVFFALLAFGRVPAMMNFTSGLSNMRAARTATRARLIATSRRFVTLAKLEDVIAGLAQDATILYLEDIVARIGAWDKLRGTAEAHFAGLLYRRRKVAPTDTAAVLFTSGSEGVPKGVCLSHRNILANKYQLSARIDFNAADKVFNALPVFHSFGLTAGLLLPVLSGVKTFLYPSPLHYRIISELVYDTNATILFGTDTFLAGYARLANPYDFYSVRYVFSGAERVKDETRRVWQDKFGLRILEGYGVTETAPVLAINTPMHARAGTVGRLLPGIRYELEPVPGITSGGKLIVSGPNIMNGYLKHDRPGELQPPEGGLYDTGDVVEIDDQGFVKIVGRIKRFAKIGGEMVSLGAVENFVQPIDPAHHIAVVAVPDEKKGEQLVLFVTNGVFTRDAVIEAARSRNIAEIMIPKRIVTVEALPLLGTGKTDYVTLNRLAREGA